MKYSVLFTIPRATSSLRKSHNRFSYSTLTLIKQFYKIDHDDPRLKILICKIFCQNIALALFTAPQKMKEMNTNLSQALIDKQILLVSTKENV